MVGSPRGGAWFYSTSYDLSDPTQWTPPREITGSWSAFDQSGGCSNYKGFYPTLMSLGSKTGHLAASGYVFYLWGCQTDNTPPPGRQYSSRVFTITTAGPPPAGPPTISLSNTELQFWDYTAQSSLTPAQAVGVSNTGGGTLSWTAIPSAPWINLTSTSTGFTVAVNPAGLAAGPHSGTISVAAAGATNTPQTVSVTLTISASAQIPPSSAARFVPVTPCRIADTRNATGPFWGPGLPRQTSRDFAIPASACGLPSTAVAYSLNVAVVPSGSLGFLTLWPTGQPQPLVATLNSIDGRIKSNAAIVPAELNGAISAFGGPKIESALIVGLMGEERAMANLFDELQNGTVSRRRLFELFPIAAGSAALASAQTGKQTKQATGGAATPPKMSPANIGGGGRIERDYYREWIKTSKVPMLDGYSLLDASKQEVQPWPDTGGRGLYLNFSGNVHMDAVINEIPAGKALEQKRHFYEQIVYVMGGRGYTTVGSGAANKVEWAEGSLFSIPMNALHRHFNSDSAHPARLLLITTFPLMLQMFGSMGLINDLNFNFNERYSGAPGYFSSTQRVRERWDKTNFVKDIRSSEVVEWKERGNGNASMFWEMAGNTILEPHMSEFDVGSYKAGHRHPYEAIILTLNGKGFSLAEKDELKDSAAMKIDWQAGSVVSPPFYWFHQHFNTGNTKARYLAITEGDFPIRLGFPLQVEQIELDKEDPEIKKHFDRELHRS